MKNYILLSLLIPSCAFGGNTVNSPLYQHLLNQVRERLTERVNMVNEISTPEDLLARGEAVREAMQRGMGDWPDRTELNAKTVWTKDYGDHRIEGILFESRPGFYVTANLYLPTTGTPPYPAVLGPCGHGREAKAHDVYQIVWTNLARRGFMVLAYDPIGQGERLSYLDEKGEPRFWGVTEHTHLGVKSLLLGYSFARDEIWDGIRALDYLESRPEVDKTRMGCTGNSGGGTQTAYLMALDKRIRCAAPSCYLTSLTRLFETIGPQDAEQNLMGQVAAGIDHADYIEACLPRAVLVCAAKKDFFDITGTWTSFREAKGFYSCYGLPEAVDLVEAPGEHGFAETQRTAMYHWMARWLKGQIDEAPEPATEPKAATELYCTTNGFVMTSVSGSRTLSSIYAEEAAVLKEKRRVAIAADKEGKWIQEVARLANIGHYNELLWKAEKGPEGTADIKSTTFTVAVEPDWQLSAVLHEPATGARELPILWLRDAAAGEEGLEVVPDEEVHQGHPVLVVSLRGLDAAKRYEGGELDQYFGGWQEAFMSLHLNRPLLGQRVEDIYAALSLLQSCYPGLAVRIVAEREAVPPAVVATALDQHVKELVLVDGLISWDAIFQAPYSVGQLTNVVPGILKVADLPDLITAIAPRKVTVVSPRGAERKK